MKTAAHTATPARRSGRRWSRTSCRPGADPWVAARSTSSAKSASSNATSSTSSTAACSMSSARCSTRGISAPWAAATAASSSPRAAAAAATTRAMRRQRGQHPFRGGPLGQQLGEHVGRGQQPEGGDRARGELHHPGQQGEPRRGRPRTSARPARRCPGRIGRRPAGRPWPPTRNPSTHDGVSTSTAPMSGSGRLAAPVPVSDAPTRSAVPPSGAFSAVAVTRSPSAGRPVHGPRPTDAGRRIIRIAPAGSAAAAVT